jgi:hypothetical protein
MIKSYNLLSYQLLVSTIYLEIIGALSHMSYGQSVPFNYASD